jgi:trehalose/maltose hydrolase-like predicted phosphorylase
MAVPSALDERICTHAQSAPGAADTWIVAFDDYQPSHEGTREAICTLANGYWGTRGAAEESVADDVHYPGTYFAGIYDVVTWRIRGIPTSDEEMVNAPNWLPVRFRLAGGDWFGLDALAEADLLDFRQELCVRHGIFSRGVTFRDDRGRVTTVRSHRFVSHANPRLAAMRVSILPDNWSGPVTVRSGIDGRVSNTNVPSHRPRTHRHLHPIEMRESAPDTVLLETEAWRSCQYAGSVPTRAVPSRTSSRRMPRAARPS